MSERIIDACCLINLYASGKEGEHFSGLWRVLCFRRSAERGTTDTASR